MSKKQWKNVTDNMSLQFSTKSWSQEEPDLPTMDLSEIRSVLPTKTSATRQISDLESISPNGPFLLSFANIPYESSDTDLINFFRLYDVVRVQKSEANKGQGILEFRDRAGLAGALSMNEKVFINRPIRLKIATKDDLARQYTPANRNRPQNQQSRNTQQSGQNLEDSDNWRSKRMTPTHSSAPGVASESAVGIERNRDKQQHWRQDRQPGAAAATGASIDQSDNWRRRSGDTAPAAQSSASNKSDRTGGTFNRPANHFSDQTAPQKELVTRDSGDKDQMKKVSIFGQAKPVDTSSKDREIEKKIEETKKIVIDQTRQSDSNVSKTGAWGMKKLSTNVNAPATSSNTSQSTPENKSSPSSSTGLEWRNNRAQGTSSNRSRQVSDTQSAKSSDQSSASAPPPEQQQQKVDTKLAPIPPNFWAERLKSKTVAIPTPAPATVASSDTVTILERNSNTAKPQQQSLDTTTSTTSTAVVTNPSEKTVASKPPVVISANGPFIDPRARSYHHSSGNSPAGLPPVSMTIPSLDNNNNTSSVSTIAAVAAGSSSNRAPTAVPVAVAAVSRDTVVTGVGNSTTASVTAGEAGRQGVAPPPRPCDLQGPWSKGPPRGLIDKA